MASGAIFEQHETPTASNDLWSVAEGVKNGKPLLVRFRSERPHGVEPAILRFLLSATWAYQPNDHGLPSAEETALMDQFEDALASSLEASQTAYLMVVLTNNGERDWLWYTSGEEAAMRQVNEALQGQPRYPVQFSVQKDRAWRAYTQFAGGETSPACCGGTLMGWIISKAMRMFGA